MMRLVVGAIWVWPAMATAQPASTPADACSSFEASEKAQPTAANLLNLADCREKNGQLATAWGLFLDVERQTSAAPDAATRAFHDVAHERAQRLEGRVSRLTIIVPDQSRVAGLQIVRDATPVDPALWNRAVPIDGGTYMITARAPGGTAWSAQITVAATGDAKTIEIPSMRKEPAKVAAVPPVVVPAAPLALPPPPPPPPPQVMALQPVGASSSAGPSNKMLSLAVGGAAVVLIGGALAFNVWGDSFYDDAKAEHSDQRYRNDLYDAANNRRYIAEGLAVGGVAAAGAAIWLLVRGDDGETSARPPRGRQVLMTPTGIAVVGSF
jgi:hypothetical protein